MIDSDINDFLSHHGVKGQRWGISNKKEKVRQAGRAFVRGADRTEAGINSTIRGAKFTAKFIREHKKTIALSAATVTAGVLFMKSHAKTKDLQFIADQLNKY